MRYLKLSSLVVLGFILFFSASTEADLNADSYPGADAVVLNEQSSIKIVEKGSDGYKAYFIKSVEVKLLTAAGVSKYSSVTIPYLPGFSRVDVKWRELHTPSGGIVTNLGQIEDTWLATYGNYVSDQRSKYISFIDDELMPGAVIKYKYEIEMNSLWAWGDWIIQPGFNIPVVSASYEINCPWKFEFKYSTSDTTLIKLVKENRGNYEWEASNIPMLISSDYYPPYTDKADYIRFYPAKDKIGDYPVDMTNWSGIAKWYNSLFAERSFASRDIAQVADSLISTHQHREQLLEGAYDFVRSKINYIGIWEGIGNLQPHRADSTLSYRYGDCKDMSNLLITIFKEAGLEAYPALVSTRGATSNYHIYPNYNFNHCIVAVPVVNGYRFMDPTAKYTPYSELPYFDQGQYALVADAISDTLIQLPLNPHDSNVVDIKLNLRLDENGNCTGTGSMRFDGAENEFIKGLLSGESNRSKTQVLNRVVNLYLSSIQVKDINCEGTDDLSPITAEFNISGGTIGYKQGDMFFVSAPVDYIIDLSFSSEDMESGYPLYFQYPYLNRCEIVMEVPTGMELISGELDTDLKSQFSFYRNSCRLNENQVKLSRAFALTNRDVPESAKIDFIEYIWEAQKKDNITLVLKNKGEEQ
ncbi:MAG: DUF3857 domain-containing protein [candidate division Zixibacteria bacterium]|nr:DUF3857 domain-containing protein [candidate division Zixibacteria bacterium]